MNIDDEDNDGKEWRCGPETPTTTAIHTRRDRSKLQADPLTRPAFRSACCGSQAASYRPRGYAGVFVLSIPETLGSKGSKTVPLENDGRVRHTLKLSECSAQLRPKTELLPLRASCIVVGRPKKEMYVVCRGRETCVCKGEHYAPIVSIRACIANHAYRPYSIGEQWQRRVEASDSSQRDAV